MTDNVEAHHAVPVVQPESVQQPALAAAVPAPGVARVEDLNTMNSMILPSVGPHEGVTPPAPCPPSGPP